MQIDVALGEGEQVAAQVRSHRILMDQPTEKDGDDAGPTPTEVFVASLAACTAHYLRIACRKQGIDTAGTTLTATAEPSAEGPSRIGRIAIHVHVPAGIPEMKRERILATAQACYIHRTMQHDCDVEITLTERQDASRP